MTLKLKLSQLTQTSHTKQSKLSCGHVALLEGGRVLPERALEC